MRQKMKYHLKISIHSLRGEGDYNLNDFSILVKISIHSLRGEGDTKGADNVNNPL